ncbi:MAG TPA: hypothetical protein VJR47_16650 [Stellaceae bacterium]|nr:hypothetical protein [Stellaceae bacterium]
MPFDAIMLRSPAPNLPGLPPLEAAAARAGLKRFDLALLERHKSLELGRHPPSWGYRYRGLLRLAFGLVLVAGGLGFIELAAHGSPLAGIGMAICLIALLAFVQSKKMRGPAHWQERPAPALAGVHPRIAHEARRLRAELPEVEFRLGELVQDRVLLDPYLVAIKGDERLLLGIWNGTTVLVCA